MAAQKQNDQLERTFSSYVRIQDVVLKTYLGRRTIGRSGERGSRISVLPARYDDDDDDIVIRPKWPHLFTHTMLVFQGHVLHPCNDCFPLVTAYTHALLVFHWPCFTPLQCLFSIGHSLNTRIACFLVISLLILSPPDVSVNYICRINRRSRQHFTPFRVPAIGEIDLFKNHAYSRGPCIKFFFKETTTQKFSINMIS